LKRTVTSLKSIIAVLFTGRKAQETLWDRNLDKMLLALPMILHDLVVVLETISGLPRKVCSFAKGRPSIRNTILKPSIDLQQLFLLNIRLIFLLSSAKTWAYHVLVTYGFQGNGIKSVEDCMPDNS